MATVTTPTEETFFERLSDDAKAIWIKIKAWVSDDFWPVLSKILIALEGQVEGAVFSNILTITADAVSGNVAGAVEAAGADALGAVEADAGEDVKAALAPETATPDDTTDAAATTIPPADNAPDGEATT